MSYNKKEIGSARFIEADSSPCLNTKKIEMRREFILKLVKGGFA